MRIGMGYDIHTLAEGREMVLGGINIPHPKGPVAHSDGDVLLHAICDAILGAMGKGDIGRLFPDTDPKYKDADSIGLLKEVAGLMTEEKWTVSNIDSIVIAEEPKISPHQEKMSQKIAEALGVSPDVVNVKGKTSEKTGAVGRGEAIEAYAVILLTR
jgi:2-C-methyl-D-erythritol 2,4-cyclodiphosphate synthase